LLGKDGIKLSKRRNPTSIFYYRDSGYLPEAFLNFLTLMGYSMPGDKEIYSLEEITQEFDPKRIGVSGAYFDILKLDWINQHYLIHTISQEKLWERMKGWIYNDAFMNKLMPLCHTRIKTFSEFMQLCYFFFVNHLDYTEELLCPAQQPKEKITMMLQTVIWSMDEQENWKRPGIEKAAHDVAQAFDVQMKKVIIPILYASLTGKKHGPPLYDSVEILGKDRTRARLLNAIEFLGGISNKKMDTLAKGWQKRNCKEA
jgi:glutamyl-tRNA synthetase